MIWQRGWLALGIGAAFEVFGACTGDEKTFAVGLMYALAGLVLVTAHYNHPTPEYRDGDKSVTSGRNPPKT